MNSSKFFTIILITLLIVVPGCKKAPGPVTISFKDSLNNPLGSITFGDDRVLTVGEVSGGADVDPKRIALYEESDGDKTYIGYSTTGSIQVSYKEGATFIAFVFPNHPGLSYEELEWISPYFGKNVEWHHEDKPGYTSDPAFIRSTMNYVAGLVHHGTFKEGGGIGVGYGYCSGNAGERTPSWMGANPVTSGSNVGNTLLVEGGENLGGFVDYPGVRWHNLDTDMLELILNFSFLKSK